MRQHLRLYLRLALVGAFLFLCGDLSAQAAWEVRSSGISSPLNAVAAGNGIFVAVGDGGVIVTSDDGRDWTRRTSGTTDRLPAIAFGNGRFVATRANAQVPAITSANGIDWTPVLVSSPGGAKALSAAYETIAFGDGRFMAAGGSSVMVSSDGSSFTTVAVARYPAPGAMDYPIKSLTAFRGQFYAFVGYSGIYVSADGSSWKEDRDWGGIFYDPAVAVIATDEASKAVVLGGGAKFSVDAGNNFERGYIADRYTSRSPALIRAACYGGGTFVATDLEGGVWLSDRGEYWRFHGSYGAVGQGFRSVTFGNDRFVAVGTAGGSPEALIATAAVDPAGSAPSAYRVVNLAALTNGNFTEARAISNSGWIAGRGVAAGRSVAATLRDGALHTHGVEAWNTISLAVAVNDSGLATAAAGPVAFLVPGRKILFPSSLGATAVGVNASGIVAGNYDFNSSYRGIYRYDSATDATVELGNFGYGGNINARAINNGNEIAGTVMTGTYTGTNNATFRAFRLSAAGELSILPGLGGSSAYGAAINDHGDIAGTSTMPSAMHSIFDSHAYVIRDGVAIDVDTVNSTFSVANSINNHGEVAGRFSTPSSGEHAFVYTGGRLHDLNWLLDGSGDGWILERAHSINDSGQIVGEGTINGQRAPFLATPTGATPIGTPTRFVNVSTRLNTASGDDVLIAGFILRGGPKRVVVRALGPALTNFGNPAASPPNLLADPTLELFDSAGQRVAFNDDFDDLPWQQRNDIGLIGLAPRSPEGRIRDSAIMTVLPEGRYTAVVRGKDNTSGNCLVEVYNVSTDFSGRLVNISTRGPVGTGDDVMIAGFIIKGERERRIMVRGIGPSLRGGGVRNALENPTLEVFRGDTPIASNDDWRSDQEGDVVASGIAPTDDREAAVILSLRPGTYTAVVRGKDATAGNGLVEVYELP